MLRWLGNGNDKTQMCLSTKSVFCCTITVLNYNSMQKIERGNTAIHALALIVNFIDLICCSYKAKGMKKMDARSRSGGRLVYRRPTSTGRVQLVSRGHHQSDEDVNGNPLSDAARINCITALVLSAVYRAIWCPF